MFTRAARHVHIKTVPKLYGNAMDAFKYSSETPTHELLTKLQIINHPRAGLVNWTPIGLRMLNKVSNVIRNRMDEIGFEELSLSLLSHTSLWKKTGRFENALETFKIHGEDLLLVPTAEEEITNYATKNVGSYKNLPLLYYQINTKFRNEKRPRSGLLRGKEFLMKDAYSFDLDEPSAMKTYESVVGAYVNIFTDLRLPFVKAFADTGEIGGSLSHEWHYVHGSGEDTVFSCDECNHVSNVEKTLSFPVNVESVNLVLVKYFVTEDKETLVCAYYPADRELQPNFIKNEITDLDLSVTDQEAILESFSDQESLISKRIVRVMDSRLDSRSNFPDFPIPFVNRSLITTLTDIPIVSAVEGEICGQCEDGTLHSQRAIEIGHTFYLGDKYTRALSGTVEVPVNGKMEPRNMTMGCYGIGVSRIIAAVGEINRDERGLNWPRIMAPWTVTVVDLTDNTEIYDKLNTAGIDYRLDNRTKVGLGKKIQQSNLLGVPLTVIVGKKYPMVEIEVRGNRYSDELQWKKAYEERDFEWDIVEADGVDVKHFVHIDGTATAINSLLVDM